MTNEEIDDFIRDANDLITDIEHKSFFLIQGDRHEDLGEMAAAKALSICCALLEDKRTR